MAMTAGGLAAAIKQAILDSGANITEPAQLDAFCTALGNGIVPYIQSNGKANILAGSIATSGSASNQSGPPAPLLLTIT